MNEPDATLDQRFSDPDADAADWDQTRQILQEAQLSWICTVRADGRPHLTPLVAVWLDEALYFSTGEDEQKAVNLRGNPPLRPDALPLSGARRATASARRATASARRATASLSTLAGPYLREDKTGGRKWTRCYPALPPNACRPAA